MTTSGRGDPAAMERSAYYFELKAMQFQPHNIGECVSKIIIIEGTMLSQFVKGHFSLF
jgi:hypothetical protein